MATQQPIHVHGVDYEKVGADYFEQRQLNKGAAGWVLLWAGGRLRDLWRLRGLGSQAIL